MALTRISFFDSDGSNEFVLNINPSSIDFKDSTDFSLQNTIDGPPIQQLKSYDSRPRIMRWDTYRQDFSSFSTMLTELKTYKGNLKRINYKTIDHQNLGTFNIRVLDVRTTSPKGGPLEQTLELEFIPTDEI